MFEEKAGFGAELSYIPPRGGRIQMRSTTWQGLIALMPHTEFGPNRPSTFGGKDVFVKYGRTDGRTPGPTLSGYHGEIS